MGQRPSYHAVVGTTFTTEVERFVVQNAVVDNTVGEHGLVCNAENEDTEGEIFMRLGVGPHVWIGSCQQPQE